MRTVPMQSMPKGLWVFETKENLDGYYYDYTVTVDGFVVSDNVRATATNVDTGFAYSDHNPVALSFELLD